MNEWTDTDYTLNASDAIDNLLAHDDNDSVDLLDLAFDIGWDIVGADEKEIDRVAENVFNALRDELIKRGLDHRKWCADGEGLFTGIDR